MKFYPACENCHHGYNRHLTRGRWDGDAPGCKVDSSGAACGCTEYVGLECDMDDPKYQPSFESATAYRVEFPQTMTIRSKVIDLSKYEIEPEGHVIKKRADGTPLQIHITGFNLTLKE